jgi:hypothetical protein
MNRKGSGRKQSLPYKGTTSQHLPRGTHENPLRITVVPSDNRSESLWNASLQRYGYTSLIGYAAFSSMLYATENNAELGKT